MREPITRRSFLEKSTLASAATMLSVPAFAQNKNIPIEKSDGLDIHIFSKHLQFLDYKAMAEAAAEMGFDGVDLSVRPKGHVLPEKVKEDLPKAIAQLKKMGFQPKLMTTAIQYADAEFTKDVLETSANLGIQHYRLGYYSYPENSSIPNAVNEVNHKLRELAALNRKLNIRGAYQNHAGLRMGAAIWEIWEMLKDVDTEFMGCQYDIRHATVEGGQSWPVALKLISPQIHTIVLKDFKWEMVNGTWELINTPIGEGMVDFSTYFKLLKEHKINVPASMHYEYDLGGAEHGGKDPSISHGDIFASMKKDLDLIRKLWREA